MHIQKRSQFTLIEILVVLAIIGILAALLLAGVFSASDRTKARAVKGQMNTYGMAIANLYSTEQGKLKAALVDGSAWESGAWTDPDTNWKSNALTGSGNWAAVCDQNGTITTFGTYLKRKKIIANEGEARDAWGAPLFFRIDGGTLRIYSLGPNKTDDAGMGLYGLVKASASSTKDDIGIEMDL
ncbi:MAG: prepilin-type N-terminal cleavage/methylation domain-containing protein [Planctomycetota bacterium]|jgi:prepilin-type N-terminal cleavage/methylation domain-containing protein